MANILITTIFSADSIVLAITKFSIDRLYLLVHDTPHETQEGAIKQIMDNYSKIINVEQKKIPIYDIVKITEKCVKLIDDIPTTDKIFVNITPARKTQAIGLLYAAYRRSALIHKIIYVSEEEREVITLPLLDFSLSKSQLEILEKIESGSNLTALAKKLGQSRAMLYRNIRELKEKGLLDDESGFRVTDAGKIGRL